MPQKKPSKKILSKKTAPSKKAVKVMHHKASPVQLKREQVKKSFSIRSLHIGTQLTIATSAIAVLLVLGFADKVTFSTLLSRAADDKLPATIGIEHDDPVSISLLIARKDKIGTASLTNKSDTEIHINTPSSWSREEVTGAPLSAVKQELPVFGFTRWTLPPRAGIRFSIPDTPDAIFFDSPSTTTAAVDLQTIDLPTNRVSSRVVLVQKQALVSLWSFEN